MIRFQSFTIYNDNKLTKEYGVPLYVVAVMLREMYYQTELSDIKYLEGSYCDAFVWGDTELGFDFWYEVLKLKNYNLFYKEYPCRELTILTEAISIIVDNTKLNINHYTRHCVKNRVGVDNEVEDGSLDTKPQEEYVVYNDEFDFVEII